MTFTCGGGSGIHGSGPGSGSTTTCTVNGQPGNTGVKLTGNGNTLVPVSLIYVFTNLTWGAGDTFDLQIASFSGG